VMIAANIPRYKLELPEFRSSSKNIVPDIQHYTRIIFKSATMREYIGNGFIWVAVDEITDDKELDHTNRSTTTRFVNGGLEVLWPTGIQEIKVLMLCSDVAFALKVLCSKMICFTCLAHGPNVLQLSLHKLIISKSRTMTAVLQTATARYAVSPSTSVNEVGSMDRNFIVNVWML
ncbi:hypothetical protein ANN_01972, partial [Periplaneta americana]